MGEEHSVTLCNRSKANFTGIIDVKSFDETEIVLDTKQGILTIQGSLLHVKRLSLENGEADIEGCVDRLLYTRKKDAKNEYKNVLARVFR